MFEDLRKTAESSRIGKRSIKMVGHVKYSDIEAVQFAILDDMLSKGKLRTDRPMPTVDWQKKSIEDMNRSDADWIERLANYKKDIEVVGKIPLTDYQNLWFFYITGVNDIEPEGNIDVKQKAELEEIPF